MSELDDLNSIMEEMEEETETISTENELAKNILIHLDGFIVIDEDNPPADDTYNKIVTDNELQQFYNIALTNARSYLNLNASDEIDTNLEPFIYMWSAGLLYKKYDIRPNDLIDETYPIGYGDQLIINAKAGLKPYRKYSFTAW